MSSQAILRNLAEANVINQKKDIINDIGLDYEGFLKTVDNKDINEPLVMNNDIRLMADVMRGYKIGRNTDTLMTEISKLAVDSNYDLPTFQQLFTAKYKGKGDTVQALRDIGVNRLGSYLKVRKNIVDRPELLIDLSSEVRQLSSTSGPDCSWRSSPA